jgi:stalled ribosome rescue protein Dom34
MNKLAVWIDQDEAKVFHVTKGAFDETTVQSPDSHVHRHPKDEQTRIHNHPDDEPRFFRDVAAELAGAEEILLVGPAMTKLHFLRYVQKHEPALDSRIVGIESADHPTDRQLAAHVRDYFHGHHPKQGDRT